jgi:hypothetical protein
MHAFDVIPGLLAGDVNRAEALAALEHMAQCADCQDELRVAVFAHAALSSARRFAPEVVRHAASATEEPRRSAAPPPDLHTVFAQVRTELAETQAGDRRAGRRRRVMMAAAAVLVAATGTATVVGVTESASTPSGSTIALSAFGVGSHPARATIGDAVVRVDAGALPRLDGRHFYELWLTDATRTHMQSLGGLDDDGRASVTVSPKLLAQYRDLEVSVQPVDRPAYSGTSVLRGSYA